MEHAIQSLHYNAVNINVWSVINKYAVKFVTKHTVL